MSKMQPGDELELTNCDWCHKGTRDEDLTETLDGALVCPECISHYDSNFDVVTDEGPIHA